MPRSLVLLTGNPRKLAEWRRNFERYGIAVEAADAPATAEAARAILAGSTPERRVIAVCREWSDLVERGARQVSARADLELVDHLTEITAWFVEDGGALLCILRRAGGRVRAAGGRVGADPRAAPLAAAAAAAPIFAGLVADQARPRAAAITATPRRSPHTEAWPVS